MNIGDRDDGPADAARRRMVLGAGAVASGAWLAPAALAAVTGPAAGDVPAGSLKLPPGVSPPAGSTVRIDAHAHIFNVHDIPAHRFLTEVMVHQGGLMGLLLWLLGDFIANVARKLAPTARDELEALQHGFDPAIEIAIHDRRFTQAFVTWANANQAFLNAFEKQLRAYERYRSDVTGMPIPDRRSIVEGMNTAAVLRTLEDARSPGQSDQDQFMAKAADAERGRGQTKGKSLAPFAVTPFSVAAFASKATSARWMNLQELWIVNRRDPALAIDVFCTSMLDFDHWLGEDSMNDVRQRDGILLMEQLAIASNAALLPLVAYNPWFDTPAGGGKALDRVKVAIEERGFIGVKIYPPVRFDPGLGPHTGGTSCRGNYDPVNEALRRFYTWVRTANVPVLAHASHTIGGSDPDEACAGPARWKAAFGQVSALPVQVGHLGGTSAKAVHWAELFGDLMGTSEGSLLRGDLADQDKLFTDRHEIKRFAQLLRRDFTGGSRLWERVLYGSDFYMTDVGGWTREFSSEMQLFMLNAIGTAATERVMGPNAVDFYGLADGQPTRKRLEEFYARHGVTPRWTCRVDRKC